MAVTLSSLSLANILFQLILYYNALTAKLLIQLTINRPVFGKIFIDNK